MPTPLRQSRTCYRHLAGQLGVALLDGLVCREFIALHSGDGSLTKRRLAWCLTEAIDFKPGCDPHMRLCNDWTERVPHLAGPFANAIPKRLIETHSRRITFHVRFVSFPRGVPFSSGLASQFRSDMRRPGYQGRMTTADPACSIEAKPIVLEREGHSGENYVPQHQDAVQLRAAGDGG